MRDMKINATIRYHYKPIKMAPVKNVTTPHASDYTERWTRTCVAGERATWYKNCGRQFDMWFPHDPAILLLVMCPEK